MDEGRAASEKEHRALCSLGGPGRSQAGDQKGSALRGHYAAVCWAGSHWLLRAACMHLGPTPCLVASRWHCGIGRGEKMHTRGMGQCCQSNCQSVPPPSHPHPREMLLDVHQHATILGLGCHLRSSFNPYILHSKVRPSTKAPSGWPSCLHPSLPTATQSRCHQLAPTLCRPWRDHAEANKSKRWLSGTPSH